MTQQLNLHLDQPPPQPRPIHTPEPTPEAEPAPEADPKELFELIGGRFGNLVASVFGMMEVAEEEIARAQKAHPRDAERIWKDSFRVLSPSAALEGAANELYRMHARELIERVRTGTDPRPGTKAEVIATLSELSKHAPPTREATLLYMGLFSELFPEMAKTILADTGAFSPDTYEEQRIAELHGEIQRKLTVDRAP